MLLIGHYDSPYVRRVAVALHVLGLPFERLKLSVFRHAEEMRRYNPLGRVPALVLDDGEVIVDSAAILDHLDGTVGPQRALLPPSGPPRRQALRRTVLATGCIDKAMAMTYERRRAPERIDQDWIVRCRGQLDCGLAALEDCTPPPDSDRLLQADITTAAMLGYVRLREPDAVPRGRYRRLDALAVLCESTQAFQMCLPTAEEIGGPDATEALARLCQPGPRAGQV
jgi:glutathione S-transferase